MQGWEVILTNTKVTKVHVVVRWCFSKDIKFHVLSLYCGQLRYHITHLCVVCYKQMYDSSIELNHYCLLSINVVAAVMQHDLLSAAVKAIGKATHMDSTYNMT
jgi:hypothetical protein